MNFECRCEVIASLIFNQKRKLNLQVQPKVYLLRFLSLEFLSMVRWFVVVN